LWEEHEDTVEAFVKVGIAFGFEKLEAEVWFILAIDSRLRSLRGLQVKTGDSSSCTSLSICISILTVISSSALPIVSIALQE
jgi:hypothetical protein